MTNEIPRVVAIDPDDYHAEYVGRTVGGRQFFLTTPFEPTGNDREGCEYVALYLFDDAGKLASAEIESFGARETMDRDARQAALDRLLESLGGFEIGRIEVEPFSVERFGTWFGLIKRDEGDDGIVAVEAQPGNYMAFFEPWDSGEYDT